MKLLRTFSLSLTLTLAHITNGLPGYAALRAVATSQFGFHDASTNDTLTRVIISDTASVRYRNPGSICETTPGVNEFVGFVDLKDEAGSEAISSFFIWFTEARHNADTAPLTIWLNGGPGSDSLLGLFGEIGPCKVTDGLNTTLNPYSWSEVSNLLFLSQPVDVGFSYRSPRRNGSSAPVTGTSEKASVAAWEVLQAFMQALPTLSPKVKTKTVHLWTESYGGHYGPTFFRYFHEMNEGIKNGSTTTGIPLELGTLGIGSGIIDALAQFPKFPEFAANNTYNISLVPDEVARYMDFACRMSNGCIDQVQQCREAYLHDKQNNIWHRMGRNKMIAFLLIDQSPSTIARCAEATYMCRDNVEGPYYFYGSRNMYDIRRPADDTIVPQQPFVDFLNLPATRAALGIDVIPELSTVAAPTPSSFAYAAQNEAVYNAFTRAGDYVFPSFLANIEYLLEKGIRVLLMHGEADYIANWFGGEAVSLALSYPQSFLFQATPYTPLAFDDPENPDSLGNGNGSVQGKVREYGNLSFAVVHNAGHFLPFDKPALALEMFRRAMANLDLPTGRGPINSTAVPFVPDSPLSAAKATARGVSSSASSLLTPSQCI